MDIPILIIYLLIMLIIGLHAFKRIRTSRDFFTAGGDHSLWSVSGSLSATVLGSSAILGTVSMAVRQDWSAVWLLTSAALGLLALIPLVSRVRRYGHFTLPELLRSFYGRRAEQAASLIIIIAWTGIVAAQITGGGQILVSLFGLSYREGAVLIAALVILYTTLGGQLSILHTDAFQALLIILGIVLIALPALDRIPLTAYPVKLFSAKFAPFDLVILIASYATTYFVGPDIYSRLFCARDIQSARKSLLVSALLLIPVAWLLTAIGIFSASALELIKGESPLIQATMHLLPGWSGSLVAAALLAAIMSSADTTLFTAASAACELHPANLNAQSSIRRTRWIILVLGLGALALALWIASIIQALLTALAFFAGAFIVPVVAGLFGHRSASAKSALAMAAGGILALSGKIIVLTGAKDFGNILTLTAFPVNALILFFPFPPFTRRSANNPGETQEAQPQNRS